MTDLVEFLRARLDERAAKARAAMRGGEGRWVHVDPEREPGRVEDDRGEPVSYYEGAPTEAQADHMVANDPARVLREVAAKRRIIERERWHPHGGLECGGHPGPYLPHDDYGLGYCGRMDEENPTLRDLALVYADHPDYREEWRHQNS